MVTMTGFFWQPQSNSKRFDGVLGNSLINSTVAYSVPLATTTTVIAWLTLVLMIIIVILLFLSFFNVVWKFARRDGQELAAARELAALRKGQDEQIRKNMDPVTSDCIQAPSRKPFLDEISFESRPRSKVVFRTENIRQKTEFSSLRPDLKRFASRAGHIGYLFLHQQGKESFHGISPFQPKSIVAKY
jgi:flagellar biosynthesis/type III secretory pathway M-ring protein FliF/YscJ